MSKVEENTGGNSPSHDSQSSAFLIRLDLTLHLCVSLSCWVLQEARPLLQAVETELGSSALPWQFSSASWCTHTLAPRSAIVEEWGQLGWASLIPLLSHSSLLNPFMAFGCFWGEANYTQSSGESAVAISMI